MRNEFRLAVTGGREFKQMLDTGKPDGRGTAGMVAETRKRDITIYQPYKA